MASTTHGTATLIDCTVSGNAGGGFATILHSATLTDCTISDNSESYYGFERRRRGVELRNNHAHRLHDQRQLGSRGGGGVVNYGGTTTLTNCNVSGNSAQYGGGVINEAGAPESATTTLTNCTSAATRP